MAGSDRASRRVPVDSIIKELGFGKFQFIAFVVITIAVFVNSISGPLFIFSTRDPEYRCKIPECESENTEYNVSWMANAIPIPVTKPGNCYRYATTTKEGLNDSCSEELFNRTILEACEEYIYGEGDTIVKEFNIACQEWKRVFVGTMNGVGQFICLTFFGFLSDKYGRKNTMVYAALVNGFIGIVQSFAVDYWSFLFFECLNTTLTAGTYAAAFLLCVEQLAPEKRVIGTVFMNVVVSMATMSLGVAAWLFPYWRTLFRVVHLPCIFIIPLIPVVSESIRWLVIKGKHKEAARAICKAAKLNKRELSEESHKYVQLLKLDSVKLEEGGTQKEIGEAVPILSIIKSKRIVFRLIVCSFCWLTNVFVYNGLQINAVTLSSNRNNVYWNFILIASIDLPSQICYMYFMNWVGRKKLLSASLIIFALFSVLFTLIPEDREILVLIVYLVAKLLISVAFSVLYIYTAEMFPTTVRHSCMSCCSMFGRVGVILVPQTALLAQYQSSIPMAIYAIISFISGLTVLIFPETSNARLPDTIMEAENIELLKTAPNDIRRTNDG